MDHTTPRHAPMQPAMPGRRALLEGAEAARRASEALPRGNHVLDRERLEALLRHGHCIPVTSGRTALHVAEHYPGWTWNELIGIARDAAAMVREGAGSPPRARLDVERLEIRGPRDWTLVRTDGTVVTSTPAGS
ncbi:hypothetical protein [Brachybacterium huguangmaarense]